MYILRQVSEIIVWCWIIFTGKAEYYNFQTVINVKLSTVSCPIYWWSRPSTWR